MWKCILDSKAIRHQLDLHVCSPQYPFIKIKDYVSFKDTDVK